MIIAIPSIFDTDGFVPRGQCGVDWGPFWRHLYEYSNLLIAFSYFAIPTTLIVGYFAVHDLKKEAAKSRLKPKEWLMTQREALVTTVFYSLFIASCGIGHLVDGWLSFYWPAYRFFAIVHAFTAFISITSALWTFYRASYIVGYFFHGPDLPRAR